jgi:hypothetical protein
MGRSIRFIEELSVTRPLLYSFQCLRIVYVFGSNIFRAEAGFFALGHYLVICYHE